METGDPKQVAVLAVVAVGALGFLFTRLGGKPVPPAPTAAPAEAAAKAPTMVALTLVRDPFSHPRLAPKPTKVERVETTSAPKAVAPLPLVGTLPTAELPPVGPLAPKIRPTSRVKTAEPKEPSTTTIGLEAIAGASDAVAFLTVGDAESRPFHPRERIAGAIRLLRVGDGDVVLSGPKGELTLNVGERKTL